MTQKYRKGDVITIKAVVHDGQPSTTLPDKIYVEPFGHHSTIFVDFKATELVHRFYQAKERVLHRDNGFAGIVVATFDDQCWVNFDSGTMATVHANDLVIETTKSLELVA